MSIIKEPENKKNVLQKCRIAIYYKTKQKLGSMYHYHKGELLRVVDNMTHQCPRMGVVSKYLKNFDDIMERIITYHFSDGIS